MKRARRIDHALLKHLSKLPPPILYHYTSMDVLEKITSNRRIWASEVSHLNDRTEYSHATDFIQNLIYRRVDEGLKMVVAEHFGVWRRGRELEEAFVCSFSEDGDSLPQWRGYCPNGLGVAIGFSSDVLKGGQLEFPKDFSHGSETDEPSFSYELLKCVYTTEDKERLIVEDLESYLQAATGGHPRISQLRSRLLLVTLIAMCSPLFKDESFKEEREWRLVVTSGDPQSPIRHFRVGRSSVVPYLSVTLGKKKSSVIKEVVVGPSPNDSLAVKGVRRLLQARGFSGVNVKPSSIPYRIW